MVLKLARTSSDVFQHHFRLNYVQLERFPDSNAPRRNQVAFKKAEAKRPLSSRERGLNLSTRAYGVLTTRKNICAFPRVGVT